MGTSGAGRLVAAQSGVAPLFFIKIQRNMAHPEVALFFRKPLAQGNYSIEASFYTMLKAFESIAGYSTQVVEAPV